MKESQAHLNGSPRPSANRWAKLRGRAGDREQEAVGLNSKVPARDERDKKQESLEVK
jgi:hypothetical protein